jgi:microcystin-dependent protein
MATIVQLRRGTNAENNSFIGHAGELTVDMTNWTLRIHDNVTVGGHTITGGGSGTAAGAVLLTGSTMTGPLILSGDPTDPAGAATKLYVDAAAISLAMHKVDKTGDTMSGDLRTTSTGAFGLPAGNTVQRPVPASNGLIRYNTTINAVEVYVNGSWNSISGSGSIRQIFTVTTTGQSLFTVTGGYASGVIDVFRNGIKQVIGTDVTASDGSTVVFPFALAVNDVVEVVGYIPTLTTPQVTNLGNASMIYLKDYMPTSLQQVVSEVTGDGTDCTPLLHTALDDLYTKYPSGGTIVIPSGKYRFTNISPAKLKNAVLQGAGSQKTYMYADGNSGTTISYDQNSGKGGGVKGVSIILMDGLSQTQKYAILAKGNATAQPSQLRFEDVVIAHRGSSYWYNGFVADGVDKVAGLSPVDGPLDQAVLANGIKGLDINSLQVSGCSTYSIYVYNCSYVNIANTSTGIAAPSTLGAQVLIGGGTAEGPANFDKSSYVIAEMFIAGRLLLPGVTNFKIHAVATDLIRNPESHDGSITGTFANIAGTVWGDRVIESYNGTSAGGTPPGAVMHFAMSAVPVGWLECNGQNVGRVTYASLYAAIGTTYGTGNGTTTFTLPDLRGEFIRGWSNGRSGVDVSRAIGSTQADDFKSHTHGLNTGTGNGGQGFPGEFQSAYGTNLQGRITATGGTETRPRNIAMMACIKF